MPEGPEVRSVGDFLQRYIGYNLQVVEVLDPKLKVENSSLWQTPSVIDDIGVYGKKLLFRFSSGQVLVSELGMSGKWLLPAYVPADEKKHIRIRLTLQSPDHEGMYLLFVEPRPFSHQRLFLTADACQRYLDTLGPDVLMHRWTSEEFRALLLLNPLKNICAWMMDGKAMYGIGNYLKAEILYLACISPHRKLKSLVEEEIDRLHEAIEHVPRVSYAAQGFTMQDYIRPDGQIGRYKCMVYRKELDYKDRVVRKDKTPDGRKTYWVPERQV